MNQRVHWNLPVFFATAIMLCCGGTGCIFEGGHVIRRAWFDYNTLATPAIYFEETHHLPLRSSRVEHLRWQYNQPPTLRYDQTGLEAYAEKQETNSWMLKAHRHSQENVDTHPHSAEMSPPLAPGVPHDSNKTMPGFVPPMPAPAEESNKTKKLKKTKSPVLKSPPTKRKKKSTRGPIAMRPQS